MRKQLAESKGERKRFRAKFVRIGKKTNYKGYSEDTILLRDVVEVSSDSIVTDHIWFTFSKSFQDKMIREGDVIEFDARIKEYKKGYVNKALQINQAKKDYRLSNPTKISIVQKSTIT